MKNARSRRGVKRLKGQKIKFTPAEEQTYLAVWVESHEVVPGEYRHKGALKKTVINAAPELDEDRVVLCLHRLIFKHGLIRPLKSSSLAKCMIEVPSDTIDINSDGQVVHIILIEDYVVREEVKRMAKKRRSGPEVLRQYGHVSPEKLDEIFAAIKALEPETDGYIIKLYEKLGANGFNDWHVRKATLQLMEQGVLERKGQMKWKVVRESLAEKKEQPGTPKPRSTPKSEGVHTSAEDLAYIISKLGELPRDSAGLVRNVYDQLVKPGFTHAKVAEGLRQLVALGALERVGKSSATGWRVLRTTLEKSQVSEPEPTDAELLSRIDERCVALQNRAAEISSELRQIDDEIVKLGNLAKPLREAEEARAQIKELLD